MSNLVNGLSRVCFAASFEERMRLIDRMDDDVVLSEEDFYTHLKWKIRGLYENRDNKKSRDAVLETV